MEMVCSLVEWSWELQYVGSKKEEDSKWIHRKITELFAIGTFGDTERER